jgi:hypothetical protein
MKLVLALAAFFFLSDYAEPPDRCIPDHFVQLIKTTDYLEASGTNAMGNTDEFTIHDAKAIHEFIDLVTAQRYVPVPKGLNPHFKSSSRYKIRLFSKGVPILDFVIAAVSVIDLPGEDQFYMESSRHDQVLMAPLFRLR